MNINPLMKALFSSTRGRALRRGYPISAYVGPNGGGKSAAMVFDTIPSLLSGRKVLSTVRLLDFENPRLCDDDSCTSADHLTHYAAHPNYVPLTDWHQLLEAEFCDILMDEVTGVASSRESSGMPSAVANLLVQLRRRDVVLRWTAPSWTRADKIIRECTQAVTLCQGYLAVADKNQDRMWRRRRLFKWKTYDAAAFEEFSLGKAEKLDVWVSQMYWAPTQTVFDAYDTDDAVMSIGHVLDSGRCATCGGKRQMVSCSCPDYLEQKSAARPARSHTVDHV